MSTDQQETALLELLDNLFHAEGLRQSLDQIVQRVERRLGEDPQARMAWEPIPLDIYGVELPPSIRSSWVFILRASTASGAERHPNSRQRMMSYRGSGDLQTRASLLDDWSSHPLVSTANAPLAQRWISIPPNVWHQAVVPESNWAVVSFHTVSPDELIEERPAAEDDTRMVQRRYADREPAPQGATAGKGNVKQVIVMRHDLGMRRGKQIAQGAHASMSFLCRHLQQHGSLRLDDLNDVQRTWLTGSFAKVCCRVDSEEALLAVYDRAKQAGLEVHLITDSGKTEFHGQPIHTCLAIGPDEAERIDAVTGNLPLL